MCSAPFLSASSQAIGGVNERLRSHNETLIAPRHLSLSITDRFIFTVFYIKAMSAKMSDLWQPTLSANGQRITLAAK